MTPPTTVSSFGLISPSAFSINGKGYIVGGFTPGQEIDNNVASEGASSRITLEFNPGTNSWAVKAQIPDTYQRHRAISFASLDRGYLIGGNKGLINPVFGSLIDRFYFKDVLKYNPYLDSWTISSNSNPLGYIANAVASVSCETAFITVGLAATGSQSGTLSYNNKTYKFEPGIDQEYIITPISICSSNDSQISLQLSNISQISWSTSSNLYIVSGGNTPTPTVRAYSGSNGQGNVTANVIRSGSNCNKVISKTVTVSSPAPSYINIDASTCPEYYFDAQYVPSATSYFWQWSKDPYGTIRTKTTSGSSSGKITLVDGSGNYRIAVKASNACGQSDFAVQTFTMSCGGGKESRFAVSASPNPASNTLAVQTTPISASPKQAVVVSSQTSAKETTPIIYNVLLLNGQGNVLKIGVTQEGRVDLDVSDVPIGTYYLHVNNGIETVKSQIVIKH